MTTPSGYIQGKKHPAQSTRPRNSTSSPRRVYTLTDKVDLLSHRHLDQQTLRQNTLKSHHVQQRAKPEVINGLLVHGILKRQRRNWSRFKRDEDSESGPQGERMTIIESTDKQDNKTRNPHLVTFPSFPNLEECMIDPLVSYNSMYSVAHYTFPPSSIIQHLYIPPYDLCPTSLGQWVLHSLLLSKREKVKEVKDGPPYRGRT